MRYNFLFFFFAQDFIYLLFVLFFPECIKAIQLGGHFILYFVLNMSVFKEAILLCVTVLID